MSFGQFPDKQGHFGTFGGRYIAETLMPPLLELEKAYLRIRKDPSFKKEFEELAKSYIGRPTPLYFARRFSEKISKKNSKLKIYLKREDLCHTGAHKINNTLGQILLAKRMGKKRIIAETGAGQHGVATATMCALMGLSCEVYMGEEDVGRQALNVFRMKLLGAKVIPVSSGTKTLKDALNEAFRDWITNIKTTYYCIGSVAGAHPYPMMVRDFQSVIGKEARKQILQIEKKLPDALVACVGGGSNAIGLFYPFLQDKNVKIFGVEAAGSGIKTGKHSATLISGKIGVFHGSKSYVLQNEDGQILPTHSISAGLDYPGVGPEHSHLHQTRRAQYRAASDEDAMEGFELLAQTEGILCALESAHALGFVKKWGGKFAPNSVVIVNLSGRGDKDMGTIAQLKGVQL